MVHMLVRKGRSAGGIDGLVVEDVASALGGSRHPLPERGAKDAGARHIACDDADCAYGAYDNADRHALVVNEKDHGDHRQLREGDEISRAARESRQLNRVGRVKVRF